MARSKGSGAGSIYRLPTGKWRAQLTAQDGRRISHTADTKRACQDWLRSSRNRVDAGLTYDATRTTVETFLNGWLITVQATLRPNTHRQYSQAARVHIIPKLGHLRLTDLRPDHVQALYDQSLAAGVGLRTVRIMHAVLHRALVHALKLGVVTRNVCDATTPPRPKHHTVIPINDAAVTRLLAVVEGNRHKALIYMAILTGMRQGELLGLQWADLDWQSGRIQVVRQSQYIAGQGAQFTEPKTKSGRRTIVLGQQMLSLLHEQFDMVNLMRQMAGERWKDHDLIFPSTVGTPMHPSNFYPDWAKIRESAGLPKNTRFHDLRHLAISTMLVKLRLTPTEVAAQAGHSRTSITLDIYGHLLPGVGDDTAAAMETLIIPTRIDVPRGN